MYKNKYIEHLIRNHVDELPVGLSFLSNDQSTNQEEIKCAKCHKKINEVAVTESSDSDDLMLSLEYKKKHVMD